MALSLGLDFGTESVRAVLVDAATGAVVAAGVAPYPHGVISSSLPTAAGATPLPAAFALQHPSDWLQCAASAVAQALAGAPAGCGASVVGVGVAFTSCTALPTASDGTPLCLTTPARAADPHAWPKLWKHHSAGVQAAAERVNAVATARGEAFLARYGGGVGLEWLIPKMLEAAGGAPGCGEGVVWVEGGDWLVWVLTGCAAWDAGAPGCDTGSLVRSTCQAGYKGCWGADGGGGSDEAGAGEPGGGNGSSGWPSAAFFAALGLPAGLAALTLGRHAAPGTRAGGLSPAAAAALGLPAGVAVSAAIIDAHGGVLGAGVASPDTLVMVMGTSSCHMLLSRVPSGGYAAAGGGARLPPIPGVAGVVRDGILPGSYGYETGQAAVGDAFAWAARTLGEGSHGELTRAATALSPGSGGVLALDWLNGARTPLMDGRLSGAFVGVTLSTAPAQLYRALLEATAFGVRWIVDTLRDGGVPVTRVVASGGLPGKSSLLMQIYADVLGVPITVAAEAQPVALGAALLGFAAAGLEVHGLPPLPELVARCGGGGGGVGGGSGGALVYTPRAPAVAAYTRLYALYRRLAADDALLGVMRELSSGGGAATVEGVGEGGGCPPSSARGLQGVEVEEGGGASAGASAGAGSAAGM